MTWFSPQITGEELLPNKRPRDTIISNMWILKKTTTKMSVIIKKVKYGLGLDDTEDVSLILLGK